MKTPYYLIDEQLLEKNLKILIRLKNELVVKFYWLKNVFQCSVFTL